MSTLSTRNATRLSSAAKLNVAGQALTAVGMLLQIAAGSTLYPSVTGPIVLASTALVVAFVPSRWTEYLGLGIPLVLGVGAIVAAAMTGDFIDQLTDVSNPGILVGSLLHAVGLTVAVAAGARMVLDRHAAGNHGR